MTGIAPYMPRRRFAGLPDDVSLLGLGTVKFGRNTGVKYPGGDGFALPDDATVTALLDMCIDFGVTLLDTAPAYGIAEERLGALLGPRRQKFFLVTKTGEEFDGVQSRYDFTAAHTRMSVERSLARCRTDVLDCVLVHANRDDMAVVTQTDVLPTLARLKEEGKCRSFGISTYTPEATRAALPLCDAVMVTLNADDRSMMPVIEDAATAGKAVLVKKALASGHAADPAANLRMVADVPGVTSIVIGTGSLANLSANIESILT